MLTMCEPACSLRGVRAGKGGVFEGGPVNTEHGGRPGDQDWGCATGVAQHRFPQTDRRTDGPRARPG